MLLTCTIIVVAYLAIWAFSLVARMCFAWTVWKYYLQGALITLLAYGLIVMAITTTKADMVDYDLFDTMGLMFAPIFALALLVLSYNRMRKAHRIIV
jgi:hypothetical protein